MGKHHFTIKLEDKSHKCYLDEDGRVFILNHNGTPEVVAAPARIKEITDAKQAARIVLESRNKKASSKA